MTMLPLTLRQAGSRPDLDTVARRAFDIMIAGTAILMFAGFMAVIALALWLEDRSIFFAQTRLGAGGRPFQMYKFRKFRTDCGTAGCPVTVEGDSRMTRIGRFLAATKLDELPQFWNVLRGDMSIVGPRPESLAFADCFRDGFEEVLHHKPGLFGPSQIAYRHEGRLYPAGVDPARYYRDVLFPAKATLDIASFSRRSIVGDFVCLIRGIMAVCGVCPRAIPPMASTPLPDVEC